MSDLPSGIELDAAAIDGIVWREAPLLLLRLGADDKVADANRYARQLIGVDPTGRALEQLFIDFSAQPHTPDVRAAADSESPLRVHLGIAAGAPVPLLFRFVTLRSGGILAIGWHDVGELLRLQEQLIDLNSEVSRITRTTFKDYQLQMDRQVEMHRRILDVAGEGICALDAGGRHTAVNPAAAALLGYCAEELIGKPSRATWYSYCADGLPRPESACPICETLARGIAHTHDNNYFRRKDGSLFAVTFTSQPIIEQRQLAGAVVTFNDISERKLAEEALRRANAELEQQTLVLSRTKADLQRFAEVTAHHLQEPARRMATYAERLAEQLRGRLDDAEARLSLEFIGRQAQRQQNLLRDVERYLASDQPGGRIDSVDVRKSVGALLVRWKDRISRAGAEITMGDLPPCRIDLPRLDDVFSVALDNALSHARSEQPLRIRIEGERHGACVRYSVSDNGAGVEEQYREKVFWVFEQLSTGETGTGIGLAILRRVAENCGGRAWIEEVPGGGCRLLFELTAG